MDFPDSSVVENPPANAGDRGSIPGLGRYPGVGKYPLQYSDLENSMDCIVHGVAKSRRQLGHFHFTLLKVKAIKVNRAIDFERKECLFIDFSKNHTGILEHVLRLSLYMTL